MTDVTKTSKAVVTTVKIGADMELEGLMLPDGSYAISISQANTLLAFSSTQNHASQSLKRILGAAFRPHKLATELDNTLMNVISLTDFNLVLIRLTAAGNEAAFKLLETLSALSLHQLFSDAFGVKFEAEERQDWLTYRQCHRDSYSKQFAYWADVDGCLEGWQFGRRRNQFKTAINLEIKSVNLYTSKELHILNLADAKYDLLREVGKTHIEAMVYLTAA